MENTEKTENTENTENTEIIKPVDIMKTQRYLCMSYNKYIILRNKASIAYTKYPLDFTLRDKLICFIRLHPDHELKRQILARDSIKNKSHIEMHTSKIADLTEPASHMLEKREAYQKLRDSVCSDRLANHSARMINERAMCLANKLEIIKKAKLAKFANLENISLQKANGDSIRLERAEKKRMF